MKRTLLFVLILSVVKLSFSQVTSPGSPPITDTSSKIFEKVDMEASFPGGEDSWRKFLVKNILKITSQALRTKIPSAIYSVTVKFIVEKDGSITIYETVSNPKNIYLEEKCSGMIQKSPKWQPAMQNHKIVKAFRLQPLTIVMD